MKDVHVHVHVHAEEDRCALERLTTQLKNARELLAAAVAGNSPRREE